MPAQASEFMKVLKRKGRRAVVELPDENFVEGQTVRLNRGIYTETSSGNARRDHRIDLDFSLSFSQAETTVGATDTTSSADTFAYALDFTWGINQGGYEIGPLLALAASTIEPETGTETKAQEVRLGGFLDINFKDNVPGEKLIPYMGLRLFYQSDTVETLTKVKNNAFGASLEGGLKIFAWNDHLSFNMGPRLEYVTATTDDDTETETTTIGLSVFVGMGMYY